MKFLISTIACLLPMLSNAACEDSVISKAREKLGYPLKIEEYSDFVVCKPMPNAPEKSILAIARLQEGTEIGNSLDMGNYNLEVAIIKTSSGDIIKHSLMKNRFTSDGYHFTGIAIDTANYRISPEIRAFGIVARFNLDIKMNPTSNSSLNLFMEHKNGLKEILSNIDIANYNGLDGGNCEGVYQEAERTIAIVKSKNNGFYDLLVNEVVTEGHMKNGEEENSCETTKDKISRRQYTIKHNGKFYIVPKEMREYVCNAC